MSKKGDDKCQECAWSFASLCLAYPIITSSGYYNRDRAPGYKTRDEVSDEECKKMFVERLSDSLSGGKEAQEKRMPRPRRIVKNKNEEAIDLWQSE